MNMMDESSEFQAYLNEGKNNNKKNNRFWVYILIAIIVIIMLIPLHHVLKVLSPKDDNLIDAYVDGFSEEILIESIKEGKNLDAASDIAGLSIGEKMELGLISQFGSDSDYDGLTDKEEMEVYKSDPLKASTSGDLYTDKYKVEHSLDINTYYEYEGEPKFNPEDAPEFTLEAVSPLDFFAKVIDSSGNLDDYKEYESLRKIDYSKVQKAYSITNYSNNVFEIDLSELDDRDIDIKVFEGLCDTPINGTKVKISDDVAIVTLENSMQPNNNYKVFVSNGVKKIPDFIPAFNDNLKGEIDKYVDRVVEPDEYFKSLIISCPLFTLFTGAPPTVLISETATEEQIKDTLKMANILYEESRPLLGYYVGKRTVTMQDCTIVTEDEIFRRLFLNYFTWGPEYIYYGVMPDREILHCYSPYVSYAEIFRAQKEIIEENNRKFLSYDRFCFDNFDTKYYTGVDHGNCAGIAWVAALIHDNDGLDTLSGSYYSTRYKEELSYSVDESSQENTTLLDRYVSDYKANKFGGIRSLKSKDSNEYKELPNFDNTELSEDEVEFTKLISAYWAEYNDNVFSRDIAEKGYLSNKDRKYLDWQTIENAKSTLDNNRALTWGFNLDNKFGKGHAVNLTGYHQYGDTVIFDVYDNNYPDFTFKLRCEKITSSRGDESFEYKYETEYGEDYTSSFDFNDDTQIKGINDKYVEGDTFYMFYIFDSDLNLLNVPIEI